MSIFDVTFTFTIYYYIQHWRTFKKTIRPYLLTFSGINTALDQK